jgi:hypothetical protein
LFVSGSGTSEQRSEAIAEKLWLTTFPARGKSLSLKDASWIGAEI